jgi:uroporphyrinogen decarboxylase
MTSRERVLAAIEHREVDEIPLMLWLEPHATMKIARYIKKPKNLLSNVSVNLLRGISNILPTEEMRNVAPFLLYLSQRPYLLELGVDIVDIVDFHWGSPLWWYKKFWLEKGKIRIKDVYGRTRCICGLYLETVEVPCKTKEDLENYKFPDISSPSHFTGIEQFRKKHPDIATVMWCMGVQDWSPQFHTMERLYTGMIEYPDTIKRFFKKMTEHTLQIIKGALEAGADIIIIGDDYGTQNSMFISKEMWKEFTYPCLKKQIEVIHEYGGKAMLHSDGYIMPLLDNFVEAELDALHPFQPVPKNNLKEAKEKYGDKLCFFTGLDVQRLPTMSVEEVRDDIVKTYKIASRGSGMVLCTTHALQGDIPIENLKEMFVTIKDIKEGVYG